MEDPSVSEYLIQRMIAEAMAPKRRKVIQITATAEPGASSDLLYALADDGTMWYMAPHLDNSDWKCIKDIPND